MDFHPVKKSLQVAKDTVPTLDLGVNFSISSSFAIKLLSGRKLMKGGILLCASIFKNYEYTYD